jgi:hypothetical protein
MNLRQRRLDMRAAMERARKAEPASFVPNRLLDTLIQHMELKNDAQLSRRLAVPPPVVSQMRHRKLAVGATMLLRMHEESGLSISDLKDLLADPVENRETSTS